MERLVSRSFVLERNRSDFIPCADARLRLVHYDRQSPSLVFNSADVDEAAEWLALGIWFNSGQDCCAGSRRTCNASDLSSYRYAGLWLTINDPLSISFVCAVYVQSGIYDKVIEALVKKAKQSAIGNVSRASILGSKIIVDVTLTRMSLYTS